MLRYLAPLHGITDAPFRRLFREIFGGFDFAITPFVTTVNAERVAGSHLRDIIPAPSDASELRWTIPQIIGNDPGHMLVLVRAMEALGYTEVNWNLGCPFDKVARKRRGSGLLPHPDRIVAVLDRVMSATTCRISLKVRLGYRAPSELARVIGAVAHFPLSSITIHPRIATQLYGGQADLAAFSGILQSCPFPVVYNGDILHVRQAQDIADRFGGRLHGIMVGRGALIDPFLLARMAGNEQTGLVAPLAVLRQFHDRLYGERSSTHGCAKAIGTMKEYWRYVSKPMVHEGPSPLVQGILAARDHAEYEQAVDALFVSGPQWRPDGVVTAKPYPAL